MLAIPNASNGSNVTTLLAHVIAADRREAARYSWRSGVHALVPVPSPELYKASKNLDLQLDSDGC